MMLWQIDPAISQIMCHLLSYICDILIDLYATVFNFSLYSLTHTISYQTYSWYSLFRLVFRNIMVCSYVICTSIFFSFYTLIGSSDSLNLHIQVYGCYILLTKYLRNTESLCSITGFFGTIHVFFFILLTSFDSLLLGLHIVLFDLFVE